MNDISAMSDTDLVSMLVNLKPSDAGVAALAAALVDDWFAGAAELRRRYEAQLLNRTSMVQETASVESSPRFVGANTVSIDPVRWSDFWFRRRTPLNQVGPLFNRCEGWASVIKRKAHAGYYALDDLATALEMRVDDLIFEVGTDAERERLCIGQL